MSHREYTLKALTDIWTGDARRSGDRLITTGVLGSIRWWFEVLVRGLGGSACDPTDKNNRCPDKDGRHCVVCELFGCTGWARKFRFDVLEVVDGREQTKVSRITKNDILRLRFTELRPVKPEEWVLLDVTLRLIADYGAIGGKTVFKPSDEPSRANAAHHRDYGLIGIQQRPEDIPSLTRQGLEEYISQRGWRRLDHDDFRWASLEHLWCVKKRYLARQDKNTSTFNKVVGRDERKLCKDCGQVHIPPQKCPKTKKHPRRWSDNKPSKEPDRWFAGEQQESKKVFSFKEPEPAQRTFGFVKPNVLTPENMRQRLKGAWPDLKDEEFVTGPAVLQRLLPGSGEGHHDIRFVR